MDAALASARARLRELKAAHLAGSLETDAYEIQRRSIEREIGEHLAGEAEPASVQGKEGRPSLRLAASVVVAVLVVASLGYWRTGSPSLARSSPPSDTVQRVATAPDRAASEAGATGLQQIASMVETLATRMKDRPDDAQGWTMLARSYTVLGRFDDALPAYKRATELVPNNAVVLADYADAVAAVRGSANNPESNALIDRALVIDPRLPKALALAGTAAYDRGDFALAVDRWQAMAAELPPESDLLKQVQASIDDARLRLGEAGGRRAVAAGSGGPAKAATADPATPGPMAGPMTRPTTQAANAGTGAAAPGVGSGPGAGPATPTGKSVTGTVTIAPALAGQVSPDDTVFVFARAAGGGRMPLAVKRARVADLPLTFKLDDSMAMAPGMTISSATQLIVGARVSKSGNAIPQPGDFAGEVAPVAPGATGLSIRIDSVVNPR